MNFFRHWYGNDELRENILGDVSSLGFYDENNNTVYGNLYSESLYPKGDVGYDLPKELHWKQDNLHKVYIKGVLQKFITGGSQYSYYYCYSYRIKTSDPNHNSDTYGSYGEYNSLFQASSYNRYITEDYPIVSGVVFIPLKNGGFILNIQNDHLSNPGSTARQLLPKTTIPFRVMPRTYEDQRNNTLGINYTGYGSSRFITLIGVPPIERSIVNNYIYISSNYYWYIINERGGARFADGTETGSGDADKNNLSPLIDLQTGNASRDIFKMYDKSMLQSSLNKKYMDFNPNVCILSKLPYDNGFIDNIYYMTTCPQPNISDNNYRGTFFSFGGRNFVNMYGNMVLELPGY